MNSFRRREVLQLSALGLGALAGCSTSSTSEEPNNNQNQDTEEPRDSDNDGVPDARDEFPRDPNLSRILQSTSDTRNIEEDHWRYYEIDLSSTGQVSYDFIVRDGPAIDVIFMDESEFSYFQNGERWQYYRELSALDSTGDDLEALVESGSYYLIFDNSPAGEAAPPTNFSNDVVSVEFNLEVAQ